MRSPPPPSPIVRDDRPLLLVTATPPEEGGVRAALEGARPYDLGWGEALAGHLGRAPVVLAHLGVGKVNTAAGLARALTRLRPACVVQYGIGGAFAGAFLPVGSAAAAASEVHTDTGTGEGDAWRGMEALGFPLLQGPPPRYNELPTDRDLTARLAAAAGIPTARFATSERVTGTLDEADRLRRRFDVDVESMEGAAAAQVCLALGVPFAEIRGISNVVGERDPLAWNVRGATRAAADAVLAGARALEVTA